MDFTRSLASPSFEVSVVNFRFFSRLSPPASVPTQTLPSRSSKIDSTRLLDNPLAVVSVSICPLRRRARQFEVPIHTAPCRSACRQVTRPLGKPSRTEYSVAFPSRTSATPSLVLNQSVPSLSSAIAVTFARSNPSTFHSVNTPFFHSLRPAEVTSSKLPSARAIKPLIELAATSPICSNPHLPP